MESYISVHDQNSGHPQSQLNAHKTHARSPGLGLNIATLSEDTDSDTHLQSLFHSLHPRAVQRALPQPSAFSSSSRLHSPTPLPVDGQDEFDWTFGHKSNTGPAVPRVGHHENNFIPGQSISQLSQPASNRPATMGAVAIQQFDSRFDAGLSGIRQSFNWSNFDMGVDQPYFSPMSSPALVDTITPYAEPRLLPMYARSDSSSPPHGSNTPGQREMKRHRDIARRDSKNRYRRERSTSNSYAVSEHPSPAMIPGNLSGYTTSLTPSPLLSQVSPAMASPDFVTGFPTQVTDPPTSDLFAPVYTMIPSTFSSAAYSVAFSDPLATSHSQEIFSRQPTLTSSSEHQLYPLASQYTAPTVTESSEQIRVVQNRPKPQCWEHGCNGRQFSTFSNLLRHQREKSGVATKSSCPNCGAEFTRTTARNGHMAHEKCKQRRNS